MSTNPPRKIVVLSGGTAANSLVDVFNELVQKLHCTLSYIIPISDNGGSSSELIRVFGGPGIGDIRSKAYFSREFFNDRLTCRAFSYCDQDAF